MTKQISSRVLSCTAAALFMVGLGMAGLGMSQAQTPKAAKPAAGSATGAVTAARSTSRPATNKVTNATPASGAGDVSRGHYLVEEIGKCGECHTPRDENGNLKMDAWLQGARTWIQPVVPVPNWAYEAPPLAGFPSFSDAQGERILEKGTGPQGEVLRPPMHTYHMTRQDALAVIAYLKTLRAVRQ